VVVAGPTIEASSLVRATEDDLKSWQSAASEELQSMHVLDRLTELWPMLGKPSSGFLANRAGSRRRCLAGLIEERCTTGTLRIKHRSEPQRELGFLGVFLGIFCRSSWLLTVIGLRSADSAAKGDAGEHGYSCPGSDRQALASQTSRPFLLPLPTCSSIFRLAQQF
jgi:hypothetical protein